MMKVNIYNKRATKHCFYDLINGFTGIVIIAMITVEKEMFEMTLLPGGALVNLLLELNFIIFVDESLDCP